MKIQTIIKASELLAVALFCIKKSVIEHDPMCGIHLDIKKGVMRLIATDRTSMAVLKNDENQVWPDIDIVIPNELFKNIKRPSKRYDCPLSLEYDTDTRIMTIGGISKIINIDCSILRWRDVLPDSFMPCFNFYKIKQLVLFDKAATLLNSEPIFYHNMDDNGIVVIPLDNKYKTFTGVIVQQFRNADVVNENTITGNIVAKALI